MKEMPRIVVSQPESEIRSRRRLFRLALTGATAVTLLAGSFLVTASITRRITDGPAVKSLAVLPLKNLSGDPNQEYLADGITEEVIGKLAGLHGIRVTSRTSSMHFKDSKLSAPEIAKALGVDALVEVR